MLFIIKHIIDEINDFSVDNKCIRGCLLTPQCQFLIRSDLFFFGFFLNKNSIKITIIAVIIARGLTDVAACTHQNADKNKCHLKVDCTQKLTLAQRNFDITSFQYVNS